ncbi:MAG TPA: aminoglycoside phosphotransferase family protein [Solirubrobacteraceae bacterium]|nr:aminoglycoside phosphotransferase family protein [Solirubrobacteraceae bacterium]
MAMIEPAELPAYLREKRVVPPDTEVEVSSLSGGISNVVLLAEWHRGAVVVKQPHAELAVDDVWPFDRQRVFVERDCMSVLAERLPSSAPEVVFSDEERFLFGMTLAPPGGTIWKHEHDAGIADPKRTDLAAQLLSRMHTETANDAALEARFGANWPLIQGRIDPYHRTAAAAHEDVADRIEHEVQRLLATRSCLVHGDFSPKNLIAYPNRMLMLDFEVAHYGDPAFDVAFLLALLVLDGMRHDDPTFLLESRRFWDIYDGPAEEAAVVAELGCIVLARVDGKSRLPLAREVQVRGRNYARHLLLDEPSLEEALSG